MKPPFNLRYWLFASRSAHAKGGLCDFITSCDSLSQCIRILQDQYSGPYGWWQIYDTESSILHDSKDIFKEQKKFQQKQLENLND